MVNNNQYYHITEVIYLVFLEYVASWRDKVQIPKDAQTHFKKYPKLAS